jgi:hypothetical protein
LSTYQNDFTNSDIPSLSTTPGIGTNNSGGGVRGLLGFKRDSISIQSSDPQNFHVLHQTSLPLRGFDKTQKLQNIMSIYNKSSMQKIYDNQINEKITKASLEIQ